MVFACDTIVQLSLTLLRLSGAKSLRDPLVSQLLGKWVASSPLAKVRLVKAKDVGYPAPFRTKRGEAVKQNSSFLLPAPDFIGLLMDLNVTKTEFRHLSEFWQGIDYRSLRATLSRKRSNAASLLGHVEGYGSGSRVAAPRDRDRRRPTLWWLQLARALTGLLHSITSTISGDR